MDDVLDWRSIQRRVDNMPRGARTRLANALGMDRSQLARTLRKRDYPRTDQAKVIDGFLAGEPAESIESANPEGAKRVPLYGYAAASDGDRLAMNDGQILDLVELPRGMTLRGDYFVVQALGGSMEPRIWAGERKLVQFNVPPARDQDAVVEFNDGSAVLKTYRRQKDGYIFVWQYNPEKELRYNGADVKAIHAVFPL